MRGTVNRLGKYALVRAVFLMLALVIAVYITVVIANMGGELDNMRRAEIRSQIGQSIMANPAYRKLPPEEVSRLIDSLVQLEYERLGLNRPFFPERSLRYLINGLTLKLGRTEHMLSDSHSRQVRLVILERLPQTLLLFGTANLFLFFLSLFVALFLSRRYGSFVDKVVIALAPSSAAPGWFYGLFLILIFGAVLRLLPWGGMIDAPAPDTALGYALNVIKHMILPATAVVLSSLFANIYSWRTFFLIYSSEDYVELARAKGLSSTGIDMRYVLRPTLPPILTNFLLVLITMWMGQIVLESVFRWPGLGSTFYEAIAVHETSVIIGITVIYGYLLAMTVYLLDLIYAVIDPRVRVGAEARRT